jgi:Zn-dependent protease
MRRVDESIRLGRVAGIQVGINWSLLVVFWLIVWSLAGGLLQRTAPDQAPGAYWLAATVAAVLFYFSLLAHELGHALVARRLGLDVEGITLWLFGGVARVREEPATPGDEVRIAAAGPLVSAGLAGACAAAAWSTGLRPELALVSGILGWLAASNLLLSAFNLAPAYPLDGGRVLRAGLWRWRGDRGRATASAAGAGRNLGYILILAGLLGFFVSSPLAALWVVFLGWFLLSAARSEESRAHVREALAGLRMADVMSTELVVAPGYITVEEFLRSYVFVHRFTAYPLKTFEGRLDGLVTVTRASMVPSARRRATRVKDVACAMTAVPTADPQELVTDVLPRLGGCAEGRVLILDAERLVGIVAPGDITRALHLASVGRPV